MDTRKRAYIVPYFNFQFLGDKRRAALFSMKDHMLQKEWAFEEGTYNMFGGGLEPYDEDDFKQAALREFEEEIQWSQVDEVLTHSFIPENLELIVDRPEVKVFSLFLRFSDTSGGEMELEHWLNVLANCNEGIPVAITVERFNGLHEKRPIPMVPQEFSTEVAWEAAKKVLSPEWLKEKLGL